MNQTYLKYGLIGALVLYALSFIAGFAGNILISIVVVAALGAAVADKFAKVKLCDAHIYKNKEDGSLLYCDSKQASHSNHTYLGTSKVDCKNVNRCSLA